MNAHQRRKSNRAIERLRDTEVRLPQRHWTGARRGMATGETSVYSNGNAMVQVTDHAGRKRTVTARVTLLRDNRGRRVRA